jgi:hypothetical protein
MQNSKAAEEMMEFMDIAETIDPGQDLKGSDGKVKQDIKKDANKYTRDDFYKMAKYIKTFFQQNKQEGSWKDDDPYLQKIGSEMAAFISKVQSNLSKDPASKAFTDGKDILDKTYNPNNYDKGGKTDGNQYM